MKLKELILLFLAISYSCAKKFNRINCGKSSLTPIVLEGNHVTEAIYPWIVSVRTVTTRADYCKDGNLCCGGSILSESWVLTAAHCVSDTNSGDIHIYYGLNYFDGRDGGHMVKASKVVVHDQYKSDVNYDIALIKTAFPMKFGRKVRSICLPKMNRLPAGRAYTIGWGFTSIFYNYGEASHVLKEATVNILPKEKCVTKSTATLCISPLWGTPCYGDSGGPLFQYDQSGEAIIIGITARVIDVTCKPGTQSTFTRVSAFVNWIMATMN